VKSSRKQKNKDTGLKWNITFVDLLFAVAVHLAFSEGLFRRDWFENWIKGGESLSHQASISLSVFALAFLTMALSWNGYHRSLEKRKELTNWRFLIDVFLVTIYIIMLTHFDSWRIVLRLFAMVYSLFFIWDFLKIAEHKKVYLKRPIHWENFGRELVSLSYALFFWAIFLLYPSVLINDVTLLLILFFGIISYRVFKEYEFLSCLGGRWITRKSRG
jgi:hypothetical protein